MKVAAILYTHKHGTDVIFVRPDGVTKLPEITNELLRRLGCGDPELDGEGEGRQDEYAEWVGPHEAWDLPSLSAAMPKKEGNGGR
jgi:hypothetical protein